MRATGDDSRGVASHAGRVALTVAVVILVGAIVSSGAGLTVDAPRSATVVVAPDASATLGLVESDALPPGRSTNTPILTLTNRFPVVLTSITVTVTDPTAAVPRLASYAAPSSLQPGESGAVTVDVVCGRGASEDWAITVTASGPGVEVDLARSVTVTCGTESPPGRGTDMAEESDTGVSDVDGEPAPPAQAAGPTSTPTPASTPTSTPTASAAEGFEPGPREDRE